MVGGRRSDVARVRKGGWGVGGYRRVMIQGGGGRVGGEGGRGMVRRGGGRVIEKRGGKWVEWRDVGVREESKRESCKWAG